MKKFVRDYLLWLPIVFVIAVGVGIAQPIWSEIYDNHRWPSAVWSEYWRTMRWNELLAVSLGLAVFYNLLFHFKELVEALRIDRTKRSGRLLADALFGCLVFGGFVAFILAIFGSFLVDHYSEYLPAWMHRFGTGEH